MKKSKGQALSEYIFVVFAISVLSISLVNLFSELLKLTFRQEARSLGIEIPNEAQIDNFQYQLLETQLEVYKLQNDLENTELELKLKAEEINSIF